MKPIRLFFYVLLIFYHVILVAFALNLNDSVAQNLVESSSTVRIFTLIGLALFLIVFGMAFYDRRRYQSKIAKLEAEKNEIKAQVYDMKRREDEIDQEIKSFESSLDPEENPTDDPSDTDQKRLT
ncbi:hypothetical protein [Tunicatimonas pelagia]|uniref:hypothetical protein n=1 Tax=Tunicatimonas pelagia TaxID=931531 RepID=UPI0026658026|nr:hypothetical protein [Tunicatimonas pelagia]WKN42487.1 hypothetical protein P0M28_25970 [Tunicatimonas pelagia]